MNLCEYVDDSLEDSKVVDPSVVSNRDTTMEWEAELLRLRLRCKNGFHGQLDAQLPHLYLVKEFHKYKPAKPYK